MSTAYNEWFGRTIPGSTHPDGLLMPETEIGEVAPHYLYRLFSASRVLLYVGVTRDLRDRFAQHAGEKEWWPEVTRKTVALYLSEKKARAAETLAIRDENPAHNVLRPSAAPRRDLLAEFLSLIDGQPDPMAALFEMVAFLMSATPEDVAAWNAHMAITGAKHLGAALAEARALPLRVEDFREYRRNRMLTRT